MRRLWPKGLAALGLALVVSNPAQAGQPDNCQVCSGGPPHAAHEVQSATSIPVGRLCNVCARKVRAQGGPSSALPPGVPCAACAGQPGAPGMVVSGPANGAGYTVIGGEPAPGLAIVGGNIPTADPTPIGVVQTGFGPQGAPSFSSAAATPRVVPPAPTPIPPPRSRRPHILGHIFFLSGRTLPEDMYETRLSRREAKHAAIAYGEKTNPVIDVPSSVVYGNR
jgi:hypothetical protein